MPNSNEVPLLRAILAERVGVFLCDEYVVYSTEDIELVAEPPIHTEVLDSLSEGGDNAQSPFQVWERVIADKRYNLYDWTIKVAADAVFIPQRLRQRAQTSDPHEAIYFNNGEEGLRGALEVISSGGMRAFSAGLDHCKEQLQGWFEGTWHESHVGGVDVVLSDCLDLLKLVRINDVTLLSEANAGEVPMCVGEQVAFHPLTIPEKYFTCLAQTALDQM
jgi:hypothetical protein